MMFNFKRSLPQKEEDSTMQSVLVEEASLELGTVDTNSLLTLLECPVCLDHITPPIKQCTKVTVQPDLPSPYLFVCDLRHQMNCLRVTWSASTASRGCLTVQHVGPRWPRRGTWGWSRSPQSTSLYLFLCWNDYIVSTKSSNNFLNLNRSVRRCRGC